jgi:uncharacterized protein
MMPNPISQQKPNAIRMLASPYEALAAKRTHLEAILAALDSVAVAFSGGADSTLLLAMCLRVLGRGRVLAVTADSPSLPRRELQQASALAAELGASHRVIATHELADERFSRNPRDRCFYCKQELFDQIHALSADEGFRHIAYGGTADDLGDHRPGMVAARQAGALAPLLQAGFSKEDVRALSRELGLRTWNKPAMACLASRFPYDSAITVERLSQVEQAEEFLRQELGFSQVRVRHHDAIARIEVPPHDLARPISLPLREHVVAELKKLGYAFVTVDLQGFRSGSMNEV